MAQAALDRHSAHPALAQEAATVRRRSVALATVSPATAELQTEFPATAFQEMGCQEMRTRKWTAGHRRRALALLATAVPVAEFQAMRCRAMD